MTAKRPPARKRKPPTAGNSFAMLDALTGRQGARLIAQAKGAQSRRVSPPTVPGDQPAGETTIDAAYRSSSDDSL